MGFLPNGYRTGFICWFNITPAKLDASFHPLYMTRGFLVFLLSFSFKQQLGQQRVGASNMVHIYAVLPEK